LSPKLSAPPQVTARATVDYLKSVDNWVAVSNLTEHSFTDIAYDSRKVTESCAFFCLPGEKTDGNKFIDDALKLGSRVIITENAPNQLKTGAANGATIIQVKDARLALAQVASLLYDKPSDKLQLIGVTGTNGKTTTTHLVEHIFAEAGKKIGLIGTLGARTNIGNTRTYIDTKHTTPQSSDLQKLLFDMVESSVDCVAMEVSSHALALDRVAECNFSAICLTNLTQDHLDFHKNMEHYFASKRKLFEQLNESKRTDKVAVVNRDDEWASRFIEAVKPGVKLVTYGWTNTADLYVETAHFDFSGTDLVLGGVLGTVKLKLKLNGKFNVYNVMAALLICANQGISVEECVSALEKFEGVAGRFESVSASRTERQPLCLVDYAHTPDGLENVLKSARALVPPGGKLIAVFGCGGDRDATKRPQMGRIAEELADVVIVTSDNPRSEEPASIIESILGGIQEKNKVKVEVDRARAIELAVEGAGIDDILVVAGKGHETYQILRDKTIDFDDRLVVKSALNNRLSR
jgi:UDP-N-acetylmuramoyl-L-alanyl-D-glutamate--2,6-diaminopimelate ligase